MNSSELITQAHPSNHHSPSPINIYPPPPRQAIQKAAYKRGVMLMPAGARESMRFLPALNITEGEVHQALEVFDRSCGDVFGQH